MTDIDSQALGSAIGDAIAHALRQQSPSQQSPSQQSPRQQSQQRVALQYRLIRNGLGNYGGHGDDRDDFALVRMTQVVENDRVRRLTFQDPLPHGAKSVELHARSPKGKAETITKPAPENGSELVLDVKDDVDWIEHVDVLDEDGTPMAAGAPTQIKIAAIPMTQMVDGGRVILLKFEDLPREASRLKLRVRKPKQDFSAIKDIDPRHRSVLVLDRKDEVEWIEHVDVLDQDGTPIAAGEPTKVEIKTIPMTQTRAGDGRIRLTVKDLPGNASQFTLDVRTRGIVKEEIDHEHPEWLVVDTKYPVDRVYVLDRVGVPIATGTPELPRDDVDDQGGRYEDRGEADDVDGQEGHDDEDSRDESGKG